MQTKYAPDNLERMPYEHYMDEYRRADPIAIGMRLGIPYDLSGRTFSLMFMGAEYLVRHPDFELRRAGGAPLSTALEDDVHARILTLRYLLSAAALPHSGEFRAYGELPSGDVYLRQFQGRCIQRFNRAYGRRPDALRRVMAQLGALPVSLGDLGYELEIYDGLYMRFALWAGDEEFAPSAQILFSSNFPAAFGVYDLAELGEICINSFRRIEKRLSEAEGEEGK